MNLERLRAVQSQEREADSLRPLPDDFYRDVAAYLDAYAADFEPGEGVSRQRWEAQRRRRVAGPAFIEVNVEDPEVTFRGDGRAAVSFRQSYRSDRYRDRVRKTLEFVREDGGWKIIRERAQDP